MKARVLFIGLVGLLAGQAQAAETDWTIDNAHSSVGFAVRHFGMGNVRGRFNEFQGKVVADPATGKVTVVDAVAKTASIDTDNPQRDNHLKTDDFFNAAKFPELKASLKSIGWKGNTISGQVALTIRDVTKVVPFTGEYYGVRKVNFGQGDQLRAGYQVTAKINRKDFGLKFNMLAEGVSVVGDEVTINLDVELFRPL